MSFKMPSAISFNLDQSKILSSGNGKSQFFFFFLIEWIFMDPYGCVLLGTMDQEVHKTPFWQSMVHLTLTSIVISVLVAPFC